MEEAAAGLVGLVGDIGGTNARFALARLGGGAPVLEQVLSLPGRAYATVEAAARDYLDRVGRPERLAAIVAACAGPVVGGAVSFTNLAWSTTERALAAALDLPRACLINDLAAVAWAAGGLDPSGVRRVGPLDAPPAHARVTRAILNAGTGCNASAHVQNESGQVVVAGEYGHASFAPCDALELAVWQRLHAAYGRVSIERLLSGPGLLNLYQALGDIEGGRGGAATPAEVSAAAAADPLARRAVALFCAVMGAVAGDVALCFGALGGVYLCGGAATMLLTEASDPAFRARFEDKGRFRAYLAGVPTLLIHDGEVALRGAARAMQTLCT